MTEGAPASRVSAFAAACARNAARAVFVVGVVVVGAVVQFAGAQVVNPETHPIQGTYHTHYYVVPHVNTDGVTTTMGVSVDSAGELALTGGIDMTQSFTATILVRRSTVLAAARAHGDPHRYPDATIFVTVSITESCSLLRDPYCPALQFGGWSADDPSPVTIGKIIAAGATITATAAAGEGAAHLAASVNNSAALSLLVSISGAFATVRDVAGWTPAHFAALGAAAQALTVLDAIADPDVNLNQPANDGMRPADAAPADNDFRAAMTLLGATICFRDCQGGAYKPQPLTATLEITQSPSRTYSSFGDYAAAYGNIKIGGGYLHGDANYTLAISYSDTGAAPGVPANAFDNPTDPAFPMETTLSTGLSPSVAARTADGVTVMRGRLPRNLTMHVKLRRVPQGRNRVTATLVVNDLPDTAAQWQGVDPTDPVTLLFTVTVQLEDLPVVIAGNETVREVTAGVFAVIGSVKSSDGQRARRLEPLINDTDNFRATLIDNNGVEEFHLVAAVADLSEGMLTVLADINVPVSFNEQYRATVAQWTVRVARSDEVLLIGGDSVYAETGNAGGSIVWAADAGNLNSWEARATVAQFAVRGHRAVNFNGTIVVVGGRPRAGNDFAVGANNRIFWSADGGRNWNSYINDGPGQRSFFGMIVHKGWLYVAGGENQFSNFSSRRNDWWRTDNIADAGAWVRGANLPHQVAHPNLFSMNGTLYMGGFINTDGDAADGNGRARLYKFNETALRWEAEAGDTQLPATGTPGGAVNLRNPVLGDVAVLRTTPRRAVFVGLTPDGAVNRDNSVYVYNGGALSDSSNWTGCAESDINIGRKPSALEVRGKLHIFSGDTRNIKVMGDANGCPGTPVTMANAAPAAAANWSRAVYIGDTAPFRSVPLPPPLSASAPARVTIPQAVQLFGGSPNLDRGGLRGTPVALFTISTAGRANQRFEVPQHPSHPNVVYPVSVDAAGVVYLARSFVQQGAFRVRVLETDLFSGNTNSHVVAVNIVDGGQFVQNVRYTIPENSSIPRGRRFTVLGAATLGFVGGEGYSISIASSGPAAIIEPQPDGRLVFVSVAAGGGGSITLSIRVDDRTEAVDYAGEHILSLITPLTAAEVENGAVTVIARGTDPGRTLAVVTVGGGLRPYNREIVNNTLHGFEFQAAVEGARLGLSAHTTLDAGLYTITARLFDSNTPAAEVRFTFTASVTALTPFTARVAEQRIAVLQVSVRDNGSSVLLDGNYAGSLSWSGGVPPYRVARIYNRFAYPVVLRMGATRAATNLEGEFVPEFRVDEGAAGGAFYAGWLDGNIIDYNNPADPPTYATVANRAYTMVQTVVVEDASVATPDFRFLLTITVKPQLRGLAANITATGRAGVVGAVGSFAPGSGNSCASCLWFNEDYLTATVISRGAGAGNGTANDASGTLFARANRAGEYEASVVIGANTDEYIAATILATFNVTSAATGLSIYVMGGSGTPVAGGTRPVWRLDSDGANGEDVGYVLPAMSHMHVAQLNGTIVALGALASSNNNEPVVMISREGGGSWVRIDDTNLPGGNMALVAHNGAFYALGGNRKNTPRVNGSYLAAADRVWRSTDGGFTWQRVAHTGLGNVWDHNAVSYKNRLIVLGGGAGGGNIYYSDDDGATWQTQTAANTGFQVGNLSRWPGFVEHKNTLAILGFEGFQFNVARKVWHSTDGITWTECAAPFAGSEVQYDAQRDMAGPAAASNGVSLFVYGTGDEYLRMPNVCPGADVVEVGAPGGDTQPGGQKYNAHAVVLPNRFNPIYTDALPRGAPEFNVVFTPAAEDEHGGVRGIVRVFGGVGEVSVVRAPGSQNFTITAASGFQRWGFAFADTPLANNSVIANATAFVSVIDTRTTQTATVATQIRRRLSASYFDALGNVITVNHGLTTAIGVFTPPTVLAGNALTLISGGARISAGVNTELNGMRMTLSYAAPDELNVSDTATIVVNTTPQEAVAATVILTIATPQYFTPENEGRRVTAEYGALTYAGKLELPDALQQFTVSLALDANIVTASLADNGVDVSFYVSPRAPDETREATVRAWFAPEANVGGTVTAVLNYVGKAASSHNARVILIGGQAAANNATRSNSVYYLDADVLAEKQSSGNNTLQASDWSAFAFPISVANIRADVLNGTIYAVGGNFGGAHNLSVYYSPDLGETWSGYASPFGAVVNRDLVARGGEMFMFGTNRRYWKSGNPAQASSWTQLGVGGTSPVQADGQFRAVSWRNHLMLPGGVSHFNDTEALGSSILIFPPSANFGADFYRVVNPSNVAGADERFQQYGLVVHNGTAFAMGDGNDRTGVYYWDDIPARDAPANTQKCANDSSINAAGAYTSPVSYKGDIYIFGANNDNQVERKDGCAAGEIIGVVPAVANYDTEALVVYTNLERHPLDPPAITLPGGFTPANVNAIETAAVGASTYLGQYELPPQYERRVTISVRAISGGALTELYFAGNRLSIYAKPESARAGSIIVTAVLGGTPDMPTVEVLPRTVRITYIIDNHFEQPPNPPLTVAFGRSAFAGKYGLPQASTSTLAARVLGALAAQARLSFSQNNKTVTVEVAPRRADTGTQVFNLVVEPSGVSAVTLPITVVRGFANITAEMLAIGGRASVGAARRSPDVWVATVADLQAVADDPGITAHPQNAVVWRKRGELPQGLSGHRAEVFNGTIFVIGGDANTDTRVYFSANRGANWESYAAPFGPRVGSDLVAHDGALFVVGGIANNQIWRSYNPGAAASWANVNANFAQGRPRANDHQAVSWRGRLVVPGADTAQDVAGTRRVHLSRDGVQWQQGAQNSSAGGEMGDMRKYAAVVLKNTMYLFGREIINQQAVFYYSDIPSLQAPGNDTRCPGTGADVLAAENWMHAAAWGDNFYIFGNNKNFIERRNGCDLGTGIGAPPPGANYDTQVVVLPFAPDTYAFDPPRVGRYVHGGANVINVVYGAGVYAGRFESTTGVALRVVGDSLITVAYSPDNMIASVFVAPQTDAGRTPGFAEEKFSAMGPVGGEERIVTTRVDFNYQLASPLFGNIDLDLRTSSSIVITVAPGANVTVNRAIGAELNAIQGNRFAEIIGSRTPGQNIGSNFQIPLNALNLTLAPYPALPGEAVNTGVDAWITVNYPFPPSLAAVRPGYALTVARQVTYRTPLYTLEVANIPAGVDFNLNFVNKPAGFNGGDNPTDNSEFIVSVTGRITAPAGMLTLTAAARAGGFAFTALLTVAVEEFAPQITVSAAARGAITARKHLLPGGAISLSENEIARLHIGGGAKPYDVRQIAPSPRVQLAVPSFVSNQGQVLNIGYDRFFEYDARAGAVRFLGVNSNAGGSPTPDLPAVISVTLVIGDALHTVNLAQPNFRHATVELLFTNYVRPHVNFAAAQVTAGQKAQIAQESIASYDGSNPCYQCVFGNGVVAHALGVLPQPPVAETGSEVAGAGQQRFTRIRLTSIANVPGEHVFSVIVSNSAVAQNYAHADKFVPATIGITFTAAAPPSASGSSLYVYGGRGFWSDGGDRRVFAADAANLRDAQFALVGNLPSDGSFGYRNSGYRKAAVLNGTVVMMGESVIGNAPTIMLVSPDGRNFTQLPHFPVASGDAALVAHKGAFYAIGGSNSGAGFSEEVLTRRVWRSTDGIEWRAVKANSINEYFPRGGSGDSMVNHHDAVSFNGTIFTIAPDPADVTREDILWSTDGANWNSVKNVQGLPNVDTAGPGFRYDLIVHNNRVILISDAGNLTRVYHSALGDATSGWTECATQFPAGEIGQDVQQGMRGVSHNGSLYIFGTDTTRYVGFSGPCPNLVNTIGIQPGGKENDQLPLIINNNTRPVYTEALPVPPLFVAVVPSGETANGYLGDGSFVIRGDNNLTPPYSMSAAADAPFALGRGQVSVSGGGVKGYNPNEWLYSINYAPIRSAQKTGGNITATIIVSDSANPPMTVSMTFTIDYTLVAAGGNFNPPGGGGAQIVNTRVEFPYEVAGFLTQPGFNGKVRTSVSILITATPGQPVIVNRALGTELNNTQGNRRAYIIETDNSTNPSFAVGAGVDMPLAARLYTLTPYPALSGGAGAAQVVTVDYGSAPLAAVYDPQFGDNAVPEASFNTSGANVSVTISEGLASVYVSPRAPAGGTREIASITLRPDANQPASEFLITMEVGEGRNADVFLIGGRDTTQSVSITINNVATVTVNPASDKVRRAKANDLENNNVAFTEVGTLPVSLYGHRAELLNGTMFVIGGKIVPGVAVAVEQIVTTRVEFPYEVAGFFGQAGFNGKVRTSVSIVITATPGQPVIVTRALGTELNNIQGNRRAYITETDNSTNPSFAIGAGVDMPLAARLYTLTPYPALSGGEYNDDNLNVYWSADDGATWQSYAAPFGRRINSELVAHNGALYVISGDDPGNDDTQDIWRMNGAGNSAAHWQSLGQYHAKHIRSDHQAVSWNGDLLIPAGRAFVPYRAEDRATGFTPNNGADSDRFHSANGRFLYGNTFLRLPAGANPANAASWQIGKQAGLNNVASKTPAGDNLGLTGVRQYALVVHQNRLHIFGNYGDNTPGQRRRVSYTDGITGALGENADWTACGGNNILTNARSHMSAVSWNRYYYVFGTGAGIERRESGCVPSTILGAQPPTQKHDTQSLLLPLGTHPFD